MTSDTFSQWITDLSLAAFRRFNRELVILQGSNKWAGSLLAQLTSYPFTQNSIINPKESALTKQSSWYIYSDSAEVCGNVNKQTFRNKLGTESQFVVFYAEHLNIDALGALSGTLISGGILFFVLPADFEASNFVQNSPFNKRLLRKIFNQQSLTIVKETNAEPYFNCNEESINDEVENVEQLSSSNEHPAQKSLDLGCLTHEQLEAVKEIVRVVKGHRNRPFVLTADRGRGKTSALAIACAYLLENTKTEINIAITSAHRHSLNVFFSQLANSLQEKQSFISIVFEQNAIKHPKGWVKFFAVDELINNKDCFHLVIVDEAASIPLYLLNKLLVLFHRLVFASTVHGYEGAGRSFTLKFQKNLSLKYPEFKTLNIKQPIRWAENDPLESFIYDLCLLNAELPQLPNGQKGFIINHMDIEFKVINTDYLLANEMILQQVFAVLVTAHYQTSPNDLRLLLDNNNITLVALVFRQNILGVALVINEGRDTLSLDVGKHLNNEEDISLDSSHELKGLIQKNRRRLKDQFLPQSLLTHCGEQLSFDFSYLRIMRIAVVPELQGMGIGTLFLSHIEQYAKTQHIDFIGTSFGANQQLLKFWLKQSYKLARIGFTKDKSSGEHSALLLKSLGEVNQYFIDNIEHQFYQSFDYLLSEQYRYLEPELVWQIMTYCPLASLPQLDNNDWQGVEDFYTKKRQYSSCVYHLHKWLQHQMKKPYDEAMAPIIGKVFQKIALENLTEVYNFSGKKAFNNHLIQFTQDHFKK